MVSNMSLSESRIPHYGGQALIEGVLMRGRNYVVAAMRAPDGSIQIEQEKLGGIYKTGLAKIPFIRGLVILWDSLYLGMKFLSLSANLQVDDQEEKIEGSALVLTLIVSFSLAIGFFFVLPMVIVDLLNRLFRFGSGWLPVFEGLLRLVFFLAYIWLIGFSKDIARVFAYHGAEHKTINTYEENRELTVASVSRFPLAHPRCGTSFLLTLVFMSILVFSALGPQPLLVKIATRILFVPLLAMLSYEIIRWLGDHLDNPLIRFLTQPNLLLQKLTTREPSPDMIEVALASFQTLLQLEEGSV
jgi:uncharacterized protein YqhQ